MTGIAGGYRAEVAAYAAAVRQHLVGLSDEDVDDLTDDLEADLGDALADEEIAVRDGEGRIDLTARFGDPAAYARELRAAAGLPDAEPEPEPRGPRAAASRAAARLRAGQGWMARELDAQPWWPPVRDFLVTVRPAWWIVRAWVVYQAITRGLLGMSGGWLPGDLLSAVFLIVLVVVSVQWGRRRWLPRRVQWIGGLASVLAVVALLPAVAVASSGSYRVETQYIDSGTGGYLEVPENGVVVDKMAVSNLFVYDAEGNPLDDVQIYDDRGRPVRTTYDEGWQTWSLPGVTEPWSFVGAVDVDGRTRWNVYPLRGGPIDPASGFDENGVPRLSGAARIPPRPFAKAPALVLEDGDATVQDEGATGDVPADGAAAPEGATSPSAQADPEAPALPAP